MSVVVVTGSGGLIGSEATAHFGGLGLDIVGIDNNMRESFFGPEASTAWKVERLQAELGGGYRHHDLDVRDASGLDSLFAHLGAELRGVGAALFVASDAMIAWDRFVAPFPAADLGIMVTYHLGQAGLVLSLLH